MPNIRVTEPPDTNAAIYSAPSSPVMATATSVAPPMVNPATPPPGHRPPANGVIVAVRESLLCRKHREPESPRNIVITDDTPQNSSDMRKPQAFFRREDSYIPVSDEPQAAQAITDQKIVGHWRDVIQGLTKELIELQMHSIDKLGKAEKERRLMYIENLRTRIRIYNQYVEEEPITNCCAIFIAESIHSLSVVILTILTFPWNIFMFFAPFEKPFLNGLSKTLMAFSLLINCFLLVGPYHVLGEKSSHNYNKSFDTKIKIERTCVVISVMWALIHMGVFHCLCGRGPSLQQWILDFVGVPGSSYLRNDLYGEYDAHRYFRVFSSFGLTEQKCFFLRPLQSTLTFLICISMGLFVAFCFELHGLVGEEYPVSLLIASMGGVLSIWFLTMRLICQSLIATYGNFSFSSIGSPLLTKGHDISDNTSFHGDSQAVP